MVASFPRRLVRLPGEGCPTHARIRDDTPGRGCVNPASALLSVTNGNGTSSPRATRRPRPAGLRGHRRAATVPAGHLRLPRLVRSGAGVRCDRNRGRTTGLGAGTGVLVVA